MGIQIDLRRGDFEAMHPKAKLFGFDEDKKLYTGDGVESINDQWTTWCACIGMLRLDGKEAQAVPDTYTPIVLALEDVQSKIAQASFLTMDADNENEVYAVDANELHEYIAELIEAQEPAND